MPDLSSLSPAQNAEIDAGIARLLQHGYGKLTIVIERGRVRWLEITTSNDFLSDTRQPGADASRSGVVPMG
jgi:hypothetical protein